MAPLAEQQQLIFLMIPEMVDQRTHHSTAQQTVIIHIQHCAVRLLSVLLIRHTSSTAQMDYILIQEQINAIFQQMHNALETKIRQNAHAVIIANQILHTQFF